MTKEDGKLPLPGQIVLASTISKDGIPDLAPKSWIAVAAFNPVIISFGCTLKHQTAKMRKNIKKAEFVSIKEMLR